MKTKVNNYLLTIILSGIISFIFISYFYKDFIYHPNQYITADWGDGIKNYYTYAYHIKHDTSYVYFNGMNYPYGELHQFTDGQPFLSNSIILLKKFFPTIDNYSIGILNFLMIFSICITCIFIALILFHFKLPPWFCALSALGIALLAPQIHRIGGHLSLTYSFFFPLAWYLLILFYKNPKWIYTILLFIVNWTLLHVHPYLSIINIFFIIIYFVVYEIRNKKNVFNKLLLHTIVQTIAVIIAWVIKLELFDYHQNRPEDVFAFYATAQLDGIFVPNMGLFNKLLNKITLVNIRWESWAYIGLFSIIVLLILLVRLIKNLSVNKRFDFFPSYINNTLKISFIASLFVLFYAFGFPYKYGFKFLLNWIPALNQIRVTARFAWVFYFVINVLSVSLIYHFLKDKINNKLLKQALLIIPVLIILFEGVEYHKYYSYKITQSGNYFSKKTNSSVNKKVYKAIHNIDISEYQAILPLPFYHIGSGKGLEIIDEDGYVKSLVMSYHTGLPLIASNLSRTSIDEAGMIMDLFKPPFMEKPIIKNFNPKNILILLTDKTKLRPSEKWIIEKAKQVYNDSTLKLYKIHPKMFISYDISHIEDKLSTENQSIKDLSGFHPVSYNHKKFFFYGFGDSIPADTLMKSKAQKASQPGYHLLFEDKNDLLNEGDEYEFSFWFYNKGQNKTRIHCIVAQTNSKEKEKWTDHFNINSEIQINDDWKLIKYKFTVLNDAKNVKILMHGEKNKDYPIYYDDLLIRENELDVYYKINDDILFENNYRIPVN